MSSTAPVRYTREETEAERLDRNYSELLGEVRVAQAGVQILFAFLLGIAFQQRFSRLDGFEEGLYVFTLICAAGAAVMLTGPVAAHRLMFRQHVKDELVELTSRVASMGLVLLAVSIVTAVLLVVDLVVNPVLAVVLAGVLAASVVVVWFVLPRRRIRNGRVPPTG